MGTLKKNRFLSYVFSFICLIIIYASYSLADDETSISDGADVSEVVKIPPPIEGIKKSRVEQPQKLEREDIKIFTSMGGDYEFHVELAKTPAQQRKGMMYRNSVKPFTGMLFLFDDNRERAFWMKNTLVSLDIIFIRRDGIVHNVHSKAEPRSLERIKSNGDVSAVLEIAGGEADRLGIAIGDLVVYDFFASEVSP